MVNYENLLPEVHIDMTHLDWEHPNLAYLLYRIPRVILLSLFYHYRETINR